MFGDKIGYEYVVTWKNKKGDTRNRRTENAKSALDTATHFNGKIDVYALIDEVGVIRSVYIGTFELC